MFEFLFDLLQTGGLLVLFLLIFFEGNPILGSFIPGSVIVIFFGIFVSTQHNYSLFLVLFVIIFGSFLGDLFGFFLGKKLGIKGIEKFGLKKSSPIYSSSCSFFKKFGPLSIVLGRQFNLTRSFMPFFAGVSNMNTYFFILISIVSCTLWSTITFMLGYYFGYLALEKVEYVFAFLVFLLVYFLILHFIYRFIKKIYSQNIVLIKRYAFLNIFAILFLFFIFILLLSFNEVGFGKLINSSLSFLILNLSISSFLFSKLFIMLFFEALFLIPLILKRIRVFVIFFWTLFLFLQYSFFSIFLIKKFFGISLLFSFYMFTLGFFYLIILIYDANSITLKTKNYIVLFLMIILVLIMDLSSSNLGGDFYRVILSFFAASIGCELLYILSHYNILDSYLSNSIKKA